MNQPAFGINRITLKNFRCFKSVELNFHHQLTVIAAKNGGGKTAVLDAVKVAFGTFVGAFNLIDGIRGSGFSSDDAKIDFKKLHLESTKSYPVTMCASGCLGDGKLVSWSRELKSAKAHTTIKDARPVTSVAKHLQTEMSTQIEFPLLAYYGTGRLWQVKKLTGFKRLPPTRLAGYLDAMDPASSFKAFAEWFKVLSASIFEEKWIASEVGAKRSDEDENLMLLLAVNGAVKDALEESTGWVALDYSPSEASIVALSRDHKRLRVDMLSDGIRIMVGLVADIAFRCARLNPHMGSEAAKLTHGLVLIDEIDLHLHPEWQQRVLLDLQKAFPKLQFVVTTHSPQVLSSVKPECVRVLDDEGVKNVPFTEGAISSQVLEDVMGVSPRPPIEIVKKLETYLRLVADDEWDSDLALELRLTLDEWGKGAEPELARADTEIRLKKYLRSERERSK